MGQPTAMSYQPLALTRDSQAFANSTLRLYAYHICSLCREVQMQTQKRRNRSVLGSSLCSHPKGQARLQLHLLLRTRLTSFMSSCTTLWRRDSIAKETLSCTHLQNSRALCCQAPPKIVRISYFGQHANANTSAQTHKDYHDSKPPAAGRG